MLLFVFICVAFVFVVVVVFPFRKHPQHPLIFEPENMQEFLISHLPYFMEIYNHTTLKERG